MSKKYIPNLEFAFQVRGFGYQQLNNEQACGHEMFVMFTDKAQHFIELYGKYEVQISCELKERDEFGALVKPYDTGRINVNSYELYLLQQILRTRTEEVLNGTFKPDKEETK